MAVLAAPEDDALQTKVPDYDQGMGGGQPRGLNQSRRMVSQMTSGPAVGVNQERERREGVGVKRGRGWERKGSVLLNCHTVCSLHYFKVILSCVLLFSNLSFCLYGLYDPGF